jgi:hypothetical protein
MNIIALLKKFIKKIPKVIIYLPMIFSIVGIFGCIWLFFQKVAGKNLTIIQLQTFIFLCFAIASEIWWIYRMRKKTIEKNELKRLAVYSNIFVVLFIVIALFTVLNPNNPKFLYIILSMLFLLLGGIHVWLLLKKKWIDKKQVSLSSLLLTGFQFFLGSVFFSLISFWIAKKININQIGKYDSSVLLFVLPFMGYICYIFWQKIPKLVPLAWSYQSDHISPKVQIRAGEKVLNCVFNVADSDIRIKIPHHYKIGDAFHKIIEGAIQRGKNITLEKVDDNGNVTSVDWYFLTQSADSQVRRYLDPNLTFHANDIKDGDIIWVRENP